MSLSAMQVGLTARRLLQSHPDGPGGGPLGPITPSPAPSVNAGRVSPHMPCGTLSRAMGDSSSSSRAAAASQPAAARKYWND